MTPTDQSDHHDPPGRVAVVAGDGSPHAAGVTDALRDAGWTVHRLGSGPGLDADRGLADAVDPPGHVARTGAADAAGAAPSTSAGSPADVQDAVDAVLREAGRIDLLVTAPDHRSGVGFADLDAAAWRRTLDVHLRGTLRAWRAVLPSMVGRGSGAIVAVLPAEAVAGDDEPARSAAASAVLGAARALAREVGPDGVVVNVVAPRSGPGTPTGDASPADVGATVLHLAEGGHYFAGQVLTPTGAVA